jgi:hypothetical protein
MHTIQMSAALLLALGIAVPVLANPPDPPFAPPQPGAAETAWLAFGDNLVEGLAHGNEGVKLSALQMIIRYGDRLDVRAAEFDVVRLYRSHPNKKVRRLALVAIGHLGSDWALGFLRMSDLFETDSVLQATLRAVVADCDVRKTALAAETALAVK